MSTQFATVLTDQHTAVYIVAFLTTGIFTCIYWLLVPRPLPGIPYAVSSRGFLGDIPDLVKYQAETGKFFGFMRCRCLQLQSPIVQIFPKPWQLPWIVVCDAEETVNILGRRASEFDRPDFIIDALSVVAPNSQLVLKTGSEWRRHRRLAAETMSPWFLDKVFRAHIQSTFADLIKLWTEKARLAEGCPFDITKDIFETVLDAVWAAAFGTSSDVILSKANQLAMLDRLKTLPDNADHPAVFPTKSLPESFEAFLHVMDSLEIFFKVPVMARVVHKVAATIVPSLRRSFSKIKAVVDARLAQAFAKMQQDRSESNIACAADVLVQQEIHLSRKQNRTFDPKMEEIKGELLAFMFGSLETTSATICWALKFLTSNQAAQLRLKNVLEATFAPNGSVSQLPTAEEVLARRVPYLDAVVEEVLRCSGTIQALSRQAVTDTQILGHFIPKGAQIYFPTTGPGYQQPAFDTQLKKHSLTDRETSSTFHNWSSSDIQQFKPERWLESDSNGQSSFNQQAGFQPAFGSGVRRCFGLKLARNMIKTVLVYIILNFELKPTPAALSSFEGVDKSIYQAKQAFVRLSR
ncbi:MAG: hypothetical protein M1822_004801 [Bathelium mastoideum]|nr:MAG: hypothetical protein M1822_004801 [Bathelium mastoideum]